MRAAVFYGKKDLRVEEHAVLKPNPDEVVVQIKACGVCGTDLHIFEGSEGATKCDPYTIIGHEFSGIISEIGANVHSVKVGDRVCIDPNDMCGECYYCRNAKAHFCENMVGIGTSVDGGFAQYCTVREKQVYKVSDNLSYEEAAMAEPIACCLHGMDLINLKTGDTVMIIGGGTIGLIMLQLAKLSGATKLIVVEPVASKRELATSLGADLTIDPLTQNIGEVIINAGIKSIDATIECAGLKTTMEDAIKYVSRGGTAMLYGLTNPSCEIPIQPFDIFKREISIKASFINPYTQTRAVALLESGRINVKALITDYVKLDEINKVFDDVSYRKKGKIIVTP